MNKTTEFHECLKQQNSQIKLHSILKPIYKAKTEFIIEANSIVS